MPFKKEAFQPALESSGKVALGKALRPECQGCLTEWVEWGLLLVQIPRLAEMEMEDRGAGSGLGEGVAKETSLDS